MITNNLDLTMVPTAKNGHGVDANFDSNDVKTARRIAKARSKHLGGFLYSSIEDEATRLLLSHVLGNIEQDLLSVVVLSDQTEGFDPLNEEDTFILATGDGFAPSHCQRNSRVIDIF